MRQRPGVAFKLCTTLRVVVLLMAFMQGVAKRIAVIGGGYAGLGTSYKLARDRVGNTIHIYDCSVPGSADASSISTGIMHPMATRGKIIWKGVEGLQLAQQSINDVQKFSEVRLLDSSVNLLRCMYTPDDLKYWSQAATSLPEFVEMWAARHHSNMLPREGLSMANEHIPLLGVVRIKQGGIVNSPAYLRALWEGTQAHCAEAVWVQRRVQPEDLARLSDDYDEVVLAAGGGIPNLCGRDWPENNRLASLRLARGENFIFPVPVATEDGNGSGNTDRDEGSAEWAAEALLSKEYAVPYDRYHPPQQAQGVGGEQGHGKRQAYFLGGPTHEHITVRDYEDSVREGDQRVHSLLLPGSTMGSAVAVPTPVPYTAQQSLVLERLRGRYPALCSRPPVAAIAGTRLVTHRSPLGRLPIVDRLPGSRNVWLHCGFGSRGLILHALTSDYLAQAIATGDAASIPACLGVVQR